VSTTNDTNDTNQGQRADRALLQAVVDVGGYPTNLVARLLYRRGLRVTEPLNLRIKDSET